MVSDESSIYHVLQRHLDSLPIGFPATESGVEIRILKRLFTPEEAKLATLLTYSTEPVESIDDIFERLKSEGYTREYLETTLDTMVDKGLLLYKRDGDTKYYHNAMWVIGIYEFQVNRWTKELLDDISQYGDEAFGDEYHSVHIQPLRVIPIEKSFTPEHNVSNYYDIRKMIEEAEGPFMVVNCVCRQAQEVKGLTCEVTDRNETCLSFGTYVGMYLEKGWGREIGKDEVLEILAKNEEEGLVLQPNNSQELDFICSCCGCCCGILRGAKSTSNPIDLFSTNFYAEVDQDLCTQCGTCIEKCQMDAITMESDLLEIDLTHCIGCGNCIVSCPSEALVLQKRETEVPLPETVEEMYSIIHSHKEKQS